MYNKYSHIEKIGRGSFYVLGRGRVFMIYLLINSHIRRAVFCVYLYLTRFTILFLTLKNPEV